jgi:hypothetical protein
MRWGTHSRRSPGLRMLVVALGLPLLLALLGRRGKTSLSSESEPRAGSPNPLPLKRDDATPTPARARAQAGKIGPLLLVFLFLVGASLGAGYSAFAEDGVTPDPAVSGATSSTDVTTTEAATTTEGTTEAVPSDTPAPPASDGTATVTDPAPSPSPPAPPAEETGGGTSSPPSGGEPDPVPSQVRVIKPRRHVNRAAETNEGGAATIWLHRALPDPTPPAKRLAPAFARELRTVSAAAGVRWSLVLAVLRARGHDGRVPAQAARLEQLAARLAADSRSVLGDRLFAEQVRALARYNRAVGLRALVTGLEAAKPRLERRLLRDRRVEIYAGGRADVASGRVDVRVLVLIRYLRVTFRQVTVSSLHSGHPYFASPGVVSAHMYGLAVDISALDWTPITGHQQPGSITERAVEAIMRLPAEVQPQQVISLLGLGGASFPLDDHDDHIHIGY